MKTITTAYGDEIIVSGYRKEGVKSPDGMTPDENDTFIIEEIFEIINDNYCKTDKFNIDYIEELCNNFIDSEFIDLDERQSNIIINTDKYFSQDESDFFNRFIQARILMGELTKEEIKKLVSISNKCVQLGFDEEKAAEIKEVL